MSTVEKLSEEERDENMMLHHVSKEDVAIMAKFKSVKENKILEMLDDYDVTIHLSQSDLLEYLFSRGYKSKKLLKHIDSFMTMTIKKEHFSEADEMTFGDYLAVNYSDQIISLSEGKFANFLD